MQKLRWPKEARDLDLESPAPVPEQWKRMCEYWLCHVQSILRGKRRSEKLET